MADAVSAIARVENLVWRRFHTLFNAHLQNRFGAKTYPHINIDEFREQVESLKNVLQICVFRSKSEPDYFSVSGNQVKTDTVQAAYDLCVYYSGPPLVTTPGSDFAVLCSLIYELISGETEESLAGAINKFSRSKMRRDKDKERAKWHLENRSGNEDNFVNVKREAKETLDKTVAYGDVLERISQPSNDASSHVGDEARSLVLSAMKAAVHRAEGLLRTPGPYIVGAHQVPERHDHTYDLVEQLSVKLKQLNITLGRSVAPETRIDLNRAF